MSDAAFLSSSASEELWREDSQPPRDGHSTSAFPGETVTSRRLRQEEIANVVTHGVGLLLCIAGLFILLPRAMDTADGLVILGTGVYATAMISMYAASTAYHAVQSKRLKLSFRTLDQVCIYFLIAGTYTPFLLTILRGPWGWSLLAAVWTFAVGGILFRIFLSRRFRHISAMPYLAMGWLSLVAIKPIIDRTDANFMTLMTAGGLSYTLGVYFYARDEKPGCRFYHAIWHLFVMMGSLFFFWAVLHYTILPKGSFD